MNTADLIAYYRRTYGIADGETYDPYYHEEVPALAFGLLPGDPDADVRGEVRELDPEADLVRSVKTNGHGASV